MAVLVPSMYSGKTSTVLAHRLQLLATLWCGCILLGLFTGEVIRILSSIGIIGFVLTSLVYAYTQRPRAQSRYSPAYWSLVGVFAIHALWGLLTKPGNGAEFMRGLTLQSPF